MRMLDRSVGRAAFGDDPQNYDASRPPYPERTWAVLRDLAGLKAGIDILEVGAGTGLATLPLLAAGPSRLLALEPDARLATFLRSRTQDDALDVVADTFEAVDLPRASFDLVTSATAFHWLEQEPALAKVRSVLRPGGHVALWWNVFGDPERADAFHEATTHLFAGHAISTSGGGSGSTPFGLDAPARLADLAAAGFAAREPVFLKSTLQLDTAGVRRLYRTYSNVTVLPAAEREALLDGLADVAERQFGGVVARNVVTAIYSGQALR